jgi:hypothetical protein
MNSKDVKINKIEVCLDFEALTFETKDEPFSLSVNEIQANFKPINAYFVMETIDGADNLARLTEVVEGIRKLVKDEHPYCKVIPLSKLSFRVE